MYSVIRTMITKEHPLYSYCMETSSASKRLYNAAMFRIRNRFTGYKKIALSDHERQVIEELGVLGASGLCTGKVKAVFSYNQLEKLMRVTNNPDFFSPVLSKQTAQHIVKDAAVDFGNWLKALKTYKKNPSKFLGKPKMPGYVKADIRTTTFTNQDCTCKNGMVKFPLTKATLHVSGFPDDARLMEVKIKPYYGNFMVLCTFESDTVLSDENRPFMAGVDFGIDNTAAIVTNEGHSLLFQGGVLKARNQFFNKERARLLSAVTKGHPSLSKITTHRLQKLSMERDLFLRDQMHKISSQLVAFCIEHRIGTLVLGVNPFWKQNSNIGTANNQNFVQLPTAMLRFMITYKAERVGITVMEQEESYTSKADFLSGDYIPTYGVDDDMAHFSGIRLKRGLYKSGTGIYLNADLNGAANILKKAIPSAFDEVTDFTYLQNPSVYGFHEVNPTGIPVKGIEAA